MKFPTLSINVGSFADSRLLNSALLLAVTLQVYLYFSHFGHEASESCQGFFRDTIYLASILSLTGVFLARHCYQIKLNRKSQLGTQQLEAMASMFSSVRYDLNNEMKVVLGDANTLKSFISARTEAQKPVANIIRAANTVTERVEQLSVFNAVANVVFKPIDLNAVLRESKDKLVTEIPPIVTLRLELEQLNAPVMADKYPLILSLIHLVRQAVNSMRHGGEIVISSRQLANDSGGFTTTTCAEIFMVRALSLPRAQTPSARAARESAVADAQQMGEVLRTTKVLVERSGAQRVRFSAKVDESLFSMSFGTGTKQKPQPVGQPPLGGKLLH